MEPTPSQRQNSHWPLLTSVSHAETRLDNNTDTMSSDDSYSPETAGAVYRYYLHPDDIATKRNISMYSVRHHEEGTPFQKTSPCRMFFGAMLLISFGAAIAVAVILAVILTEPDSMRYTSHNNISTLNDSFLRQREEILRKNICQLVDLMFDIKGLPNRRLDECDVSLLKRKGSMVVTFARDVDDSFIIHDALNINSIVLSNTKDLEEKLHSKTNFSLSKNVSNTITEEASARKDQTTMSSVPASTSPGKISITSSNPASTTLSAKAPTTSPGQAAKTSSVPTSTPLSVPSSTASSIPAFTKGMVVSKSSMNPFMSSPFHTSKTTIPVTRPPNKQTSSVAGPELTSFNEYFNDISFLTNLDGLLPGGGATTEDILSVDNMTFPTEFAPSTKDDNSSFIETETYRENSTASTLYDQIQPSITLRPPEGGTEARILTSSGDFQLTDNNYLSTETVMLHSNFTSATRINDEDLQTIHNTHNYDDSVSFFNPATEETQATLKMNLQPTPSQSSFTTNTNEQGQLLSSYASLTPQNVRSSLSRPSQSSLATDLRFVTEHIVSTSYDEEKPIMATSMRDSSSPTSYLHPPASVSVNENLPVGQSFTQSTATRDMTYSTTLPVNIRNSDSTQTQEAEILHATTYSSNNMYSHTETMHTETNVYTTLAMLDLQKYFTDLSTRKRSQGVIVPTATYTRSYNTQKMSEQTVDSASPGTALMHDNEQIKATIVSLVQTADNTQLHTTLMQDIEQLTATKTSLDQTADATLPHSTLVQDSKLLTATKTSLDQTADATLPHSTLVKDSKLLSATKIKDQTADATLLYTTLVHGTKPLITSKPSLDQTSDTTLSHATLLQNTEALTATQIGVDQQTDHTTLSYSTPVHDTEPLTATQIGVNQQTDHTTMSYSTLVHDTKPLTATQIGVNQQTHHTTMSHATLVHGTKPLTATQIGVDQQTDHTTMSYSTLVHGTKPLTATQIGVDQQTDHTTMSYSTLVHGTKPLTATQIGVDQQTDHTTMSYSTLVHDTKPLTATQIGVDQQTDHTTMSYSTLVHDTEPLTATQIGVNQQTDHTTMSYSTLVHDTKPLTATQIGVNQQTHHTTMSHATLMQNTKPLTATQIGVDQQTDHTTMSYSTLVHDTKPLTATQIGVDQQTDHTTMSYSTLVHDTKPLTATQIGVGQQTDHTTLSYSTLVHDTKPLTATQIGVDQQTDHTTMSFSTLVHDTKPLTATQIGVGQQTDHTTLSYSTLVHGTKPLSATQIGVDQQTDHTTLSYSTLVHDTKPLTATQIGVGQQTDHTTLSYSTLVHDTKPLTATQIGVDQQTDHTTMSFSTLVHDTKPLTATQIGVDQQTGHTTMSYSTLVHGTKPLSATQIGVGQQTDHTTLSYSTLVHDTKPLTATQIGVGQQTDHTTMSYSTLVHDTKPLTATQIGVNQQTDHTTMSYSTLVHDTKPLTATQIGVNQQTDHTTMSYSTLVHDTKPLTATQIGVDQQTDLTTMSYSTLVHDTKLLTATQIGVNQQTHHTTMSHATLLQNTEPLTATQIGVGQQTDLTTMSHSTLVHDTVQPIATKISPERASDTTQTALVHNTTPLTATKMITNATRVNDKPMSSEIITNYQGTEYTATMLHTKEPKPLTVSQIALDTTRTFDLSSEMLTSDKSLLHTTYTSDIRREASLTSTQIVIDSTKVYQTASTVWLRSPEVLGRIQKQPIKSSEKQIDGSSEYITTLLQSSYTDDLQSREGKTTLFGSNTMSPDFTSLTLAIGSLSTLTPFSPSKDEVKAIPIERHSNRSVRPLNLTTPPSQLEQMFKTPAPSTLSPGVITRNSPGNNNKDIIPSMAVNTNTSAQDNAELSFDMFIEKSGKSTSPMPSASTGSKSFQSSSAVIGDSLPGIPSGKFGKIQQIKTQVQNIKLPQNIWSTTPVPAKKAGANSGRFLFDVADLGNNFFGING